jgi:cystathionine beta-lyase family protein involved in aluminum resistance
MTRRTLKITMRIRGHIITLAVFALLLATTTALSVSAAPDDAEVRGVVERIFQQLKSGDYDALYETLPTAQQRRISRERFTRALGRTRDLYALDRMEIGAIRTSNDLAVVDTVMYGRVLRPIQIDGKIVAQQ